MPVKRKSNVVNILTQIGELDNASIKVGIVSPEGAEPKATLAPSGFEYNPKVSIAQAAIWNEYGTANIPARPAFRNTSRNPDVLAQFARVAVQVFQDDRDAMLEMQKAAREMAKTLRENIFGFDTPPNAPRTIAQKGFNNPLIATYQTLEKISWEVRVGPSKASGK